MIVENSQQFFVFLENKSFKFKDKEYYIYIQYTMSKNFLPTSHKCQWNRLILIQRKVGTQKRFLSMT